MPSSKLPDRNSKAPWDKLGLEPSTRRFSTPDAAVDKKTAAHRTSNVMQRNTTCSVASDYTITERPRRDARGGADRDSHSAHPGYREVCAPSQNYVVASVYSIAGERANPRRRRLPDARPAATPTPGHQFLID